MTTLSGKHQLLLFRKILQLVLLSGFLLLVCSGCSGEKHRNGTPVRVAFSFGAEWLDLYQAMEDMVVRAAAESESLIEFKFWYADGDLEKESLNIDKAIASKPDILVLMPISAEEILPHIEHARVRKIPVIVYNRMQKSHTLIRPDIFIGLDTYNQAYTTAIGLFKLMQQDDIPPKPVLMLGDLRDSNAVNRLRGFEKAAEDFGVQFVEKIETDWNAKKAAEELERALEEHPELNSILLSSDFMITEIKRVLSEHQRWVPYGESRHMYLGAQDTFSAAVPLIRGGYIDVDTAFDVWPMSTTLIQAINTLAAGQVPAQNVFLVPGRVVTQKNIDTMKDLWSLEAD